MALQLLTHSKKKANGKTYTYYSIAEPYWEDKKNKKRILFYLGSLTPIQAQQIRNILKVTRSEDTITATFEDLLFENHWRYLDIAFLNHLWDQEWKGLSSIFPSPEETSKNRLKDISTADIVKLLTFYRCLDPGSYLSAVEWFETTTCNLLLDMDSKHVNESRFYRELTAIEKQKENIEQWLYKTLKNRNEKSMRIIFYDLTDSYFEGRKCPIAKPGRTKAHGFREKRIVLSLLVNSEGYPFSWKILEDYTADVSTLTKNTDLWQKQFNFSKIILVFDRGMVSDENLLNLENKQSYLYITALDKPQIAGVEKINLDRFKDFTNETTEKEILSTGLTKYDEVTFYEDMGIDSTGRRHILIFNSDLLKDQRKSREKLIEMAIKELEEEKKSLLNAIKSRNHKPTEQRIDNMLKKFGVQSYIDPKLESINISGESGSMISSFNLTYTKNVEAIKKAMLVDGIWALVTNITDTIEPEDYRLKPEEIICAYRDKNRIEEAFRDVKSFIKFQPTFVYTDDHVRAHYTICILSYLLDMTVTNRLRPKPIKGIGSVDKVHRILRRCEVGKLSVKGTNCSGLKLMPLTEEQKNVLKLFDCNYIVRGEFLKSIGVK
ncbi:MAG: IS1634 family transposase [Candidatus Methanoperedens sp.]|nr:IS1634 family transposase [Candidatus Methanoperedens sp.]